VTATPVYRTVLLDLDGTLIDSEELILGSFRHTMEQHLGRMPPDEAWLESMGRPLVTQLREFARGPEEAEAMLATYQEHHASRHDELLRSFPEIREVVVDLGRAGLALGIVTSKLRENALRGLKRCGFELGWFQSIVTASDVERHKPDPTPVRKALEEMGEEEPGRALFVGDSIHDLRAGRRAGTATAAALWGPYDRERLAPGEPDHWLGEPGELRELLSL
jgi:pyrophosphatase PpaX